MEYLYLSSGSLSAERATGIFNSRRISCRRAETCHPAGAHVLVTNAEVARDDTRLHAFCGSAFVGDRFLNNFAPRTGAETIRACRDIAADPACASGTFTAILADLATGDAEFFIDDLNSAPCFIARHALGFAVSSNPHMLADWLVAQGVKPTRSIEPALSHLIFSSGLTAGDLYREIRTVGPAERPVVRNSRLDLVFNDPIWPGLLSASYDEIIDEAAARIRRQVLALTETGADTWRVFDITGGMDSRIILAALAGTGAIGEWSFHNYHDPSHPDANFAHFIAEKWGLRQWPREEGRILPPLGRAMLDLYLSFGTELKGATRADRYRPDFLHLTGAFGELGGKSMDTKRFRQETPPQDPAAGAGATFANPGLQARYVDAYLGHAGLLDDAIGFAPGFAGWARRAVSRQIDLARGADPSFDRMPAVFYQRGKARSHFGMAAWQRGMREQAASLLNSPYLTAAAVKIGADRSRPGRVNFDLIRRLGGDEIAALPLVADRWSDALFASAEEAARFQAPPITGRSDRLFGEPARRFEVPAAGLQPFRDALWQPRGIGPAGPLPNDPQSPPRDPRIARLAGLADALLRQGPACAEVAEFLPEASVRALVHGARPAPGLIATVIHTLQFFCQAEMWMRGMEEAPFPA